MRKKYLCVEIIQHCNMYKVPFSISYKKYESLEKLKNDLLLEFEGFDDVQFTEIYDFNLI